MRPLPLVAGPAYAIPFGGAYTLWIVLEMATSLRKRARDKSSWRDRGSYGVIIVLLWTGISLDFALSSLATTAAIRWERTPIFCAGITLMLAGLAFRFYAMSLLGRFFTYRVAVQIDQTVVEAGLYK
ncbi:MAG TPA: isoprenylcysteine carboxylmethyltransferase family protein [Candidatus Acidoferrales bacterium]